MASPASIAKHPIHPMLVVFPLGLLNFSLAADMVHAVKGDPKWKETAKASMEGGILGALAAAIPGFIDYLTLKGHEKKLATAHMGLNLAGVVLYSYNLWRRMKDPSDKMAVYLSAIGAAGLFASGWLGGELVHVHGIAVEPQESSGRIETKISAIK